jgi:16S rRNA (cytidine1402-2'-O)-methyltransferase
VKIALVALPIGNVQDLSPRARQRLEEAGLVLCEDTRKFQSLAAHAGFKASGKILSFPAFKERDWNWEAFFRDYKGKTVALVSDAGTPLVNDPGEELVREAQKQGLEIEAVPGPCAPILLYQWTAGFGLPLTFAGFVPKNHKKKFFERLETTKSFIFFDSRHECLDTLEHLQSAGLGERALFVGREMSKTHEELFKGTVAQAHAWLAKLIQKDSGVGELTFLLEGLGETPVGAGIEFEELLKIRFGSDKEASKLLAKLSGRTSSDCYGAIQKCKKS